MPSQSPLRSQIDIEVRYKETDQMGHVHHANYIVWFELARTQLCRDVGVPYQEIEASGYFLIVSGVELRYLEPAHYGDVVTVECWIERLASRLLRFAYEVRRGDRLLATGTTQHVWVDKETKRPRRMPEALRAPFSQAAAASSLPVE